MKKLILVLGFLLLVQTTQSKDIADIIYRDSIEAADTVGSDTQTFDTTFGVWVKVDGATQINTFVRLVPLGPVEGFPDVIDTNFANDTFFVNVQFSFDKTIIVSTVLLDTLFDDTDAQTGAGDIVANDIVGDFMRPMLIHNTQKRPVLSFENVYGKRLRFYFTIQR